MEYSIIIILIALITIQQYIIQLFLQQNDNFKHFLTEVTTKLVQLYNFFLQASHFQEAETEVDKCIYNIISKHNHNISSI